MIDLYTWSTPNGRKASIMLEEVGLKYTVIPTDISKNESRTDDFLAMNPNGKIPVIVDRDAGRTVVESGAILLYLADKSGQLLPTGDTLEWMFFQAAHVGPMLGQLGYFKVFAKEPVPAAIAQFEAEVARVLGVLDTRLAKSANLGGSGFGLADIMTYPWVVAARDRLGVDFSAMPQLTRWLAETAVRPGVARGMAVPASA